VLADAPLPEQGVEILNMRTDSAEAVLAAALATAPAGGEA
jgi:tellurite resistance protein